MKKKLLQILLLIVITLRMHLVFADKQVTLTDIDGLGGAIEFNKPIHDEQGELTSYYPITVTFSGMAVNSGLGELVSENLNIGGEQEDEHTPQELYQLIDSVFGSSAANKLKDLYLNGVDEDISQ